MFRECKDVKRLRTQQQQRLKCLTANAAEIQRLHTKIAFTSLPSVLSIRRHEKKVGFKSGDSEDIQSSASHAPEFICTS